MQRLGGLSPTEFERRLQRGKLRLQIGPYVYRLQSNLGAVAEGLSLLYRDFPLAPDDTFVDFDVALTSRGLGQRLRRRAEFRFDHQSPFESIPTGQAYAFLEWGMNWCVSLYPNEYLKLHAAVVSRAGRAMIMPGVPGAGKSTLCAALGLRGWRILSDEHALVPLQTSTLVPLCRPVSLKNASIDIIREFDPSAQLGPLSRETHKGVVAHMKADLAPDSHDPEAVPAGLILFPRFSSDEPQVLRPRRRTESFIIAAYHSFNYSVLGAAGFEAMKFLLEELPCYDLVYHNLDWAVRAVDEVAG